MPDNPKKDININLLQQKEVIENKKQYVIPEEVVKENMSMVEVQAANIAGRSNLPVGIDFDDLVSWGIEGLIKAYKNFDSKKGTNFKTYAYYRIRGEMYDKIRKEWHYRNPNDYNEFRKKIRERIAAAAEQALETDKNPTKAYADTLVNHSAMVCLLSLDTIGDVQSNQFSSEKETDVEQHQENILLEEINKLDPDERNIIELFYIQEKKQKDIASTLNCSRSKICRIHMRALEKLRNKIKKRVNELY
jgi:RNA polymerase sigma factor FliA